MCFLSTESRQQLTNMIVKIIQTNLITLLNLDGFSLDKDGEHGEQILETLCASNIKLEYLNMSNTKVWWIQEERLQLLLAFLREQDQLVEFDFRLNFLASDCSESLLTTIAQTPQLCSQLKKL